MVHVCRGEKSVQMSFSWSETLLGIKYNGREARLLVMMAFEIYRRDHGQAYFPGNFYMPAVNM